MNATVHLVRHGQVENPAKVIYGRLPGYHLSEKGRKQAAAAGERLAGNDIGVIWASPLERAQETAAAIAAHHDVEIVTDDRLIESGTTLEGLARTVVGLVAVAQTLVEHAQPVAAVSWGESFEEIRARMLPAIQEAVDSSGGREVVIVSHQTPVLVARLALARRRVPPWLGGVPCTTGSITTMVIEDERVVSAAYFRPAVK